MNNNCSQKSEFKKTARKNCPTDLKKKYPGKNFEYAELIFFLK